MTDVQMEAFREAVASMPMLSQDPNLAFVDLDTGTLFAALDSPDPEVQRFQRMVEQALDLQLEKALRAGDTSAVRHKLQDWYFSNGRTSENHDWLIRLLDMEASGKPLHLREEF